MRLRLFSMYKRLKIKVEEEERRREKEVSFGVLEKNTAHKKQFKRERFSFCESSFLKKVNFDLFSRPKKRSLFLGHTKISHGPHGKEGQLLAGKTTFFSREKGKHFVEEKQRLTTRCVSYLNCKSATGIGIGSDENVL